MRRYVDEVLNEGRLEALDELASPDYKRYLSANAGPLNAEVQKKRLAGLRTAFPDLQFIIEDLIAENDRVVIRGTVRGTHQSAFSGIQPTGKQVTVAALEIIRIENGKFVEHWGGPDTYNLLQQLGAIE